MKSIHFRHILMVTTLACSALLGPAISQATTADVSEGYFDGQIDLGYRSVSTEREFVRVLEYTDKQSGITGNLLLNGGEGQNRYFLQGNYLNDQEYRGDLNLDSHSVFRLELATESMVHNLEHFNYVDRVAPADGSVAPNQNGYVTFQDKNPEDRYQIEVNQSSAHARIKHPTYPAHVNLSYWRQEKDGHAQLRFTDEGNGGQDPNNTGTPNSSCRKCHMMSQTRNIDWVTDEFSAGVDAHVGPIDIIVEQLYREFRDQNDILLDQFGSHGFTPPNREAGIYQHDEAPDSRLSKTTVKLHTSLAGGLVGAGAFSVGTMENESKLTDVQPTTSETDFYQAAGDVTYIINPQLTLNFRYRLTDLDNENTDTLNAVGTNTTSPAVAVRDNVDVTRASYEGSISYRPSRNYTLRAEYRYLEIDRGNTGPAIPFAIVGGLAQPDPVWDLPEQENIHRAKLSLQARPVGSYKLKLKAHYIYETSEDPAYGTSFEDRHEGYLGATLNPSRRWGIQASARYNTENNDGKTTELFDADGVLVNQPRSRECETTNLLGSVWVMPTERLNVSASYGFLMTDIRQDLIFGGTPDGATTQGRSIFDDKVDYEQRVHTASMLFDWRIIETLRASAEGRYIRSKAFFDPDFPTAQYLFPASGTQANVDISSTGLKEITEVDIVQSGVSLGLDWNPLPAWICSLNYSFDDYDDRNSDVFDGSAQAYMVSVGHSW